MTLGDLYDEFGPRLRRYAASLARDAYQADDLLQETFIRATVHRALLRQLNRYQRQAWLYRVLKNLFIDEQRSRQRQEDLVEQLTQQAEIAPFTPDDLVFTDLLEMASDSDRELLEQRYVLGMTSREIAEELDIPPATVRSRLRLVIKRLRAHYRKEQI